MAPVILIYTPSLTPRIVYAAEVLFTHVLKQSYSLVQDVEQFKRAEAPKLAYSFQNIEGVPTVIAQGLLHEKEIEQFEVPVEKQEGDCFLFPNKDKVLGFDVFAATFYLVSRYEEYLPHKKDKHGRFHSSQSLASLHGFLQEPLVNQWAEKLLKFLQNNCPSLSDKRKYNFTPTIDVDSAFLYLDKGFVRTLGGYVRSLLQADIKTIIFRTKTILNLQKDPLDVFDEVLEIQKHHNSRILYFFLVADYGLNDKNVPIHSRRFRSLIKHLSDYCPIGIHPSYASNSQPEKLKTEVQRLAEITHKSILHSRQHFLIFSLPNTFRRLIELGITHEYSMGYPDQPGFRASIANPFPFYDLEQEKPSGLMLHPFSLMEATYKYYRVENLNELRSEINRQSELLKGLKAEFCPLWHNDSLSEIEEWKGWSESFLYLMEQATP